MCTDLAEKSNRKCVGGNAMLPSRPITIVAVRVATTCICDKSGCLSLDSLDGSSVFVCVWVPCSNCIFQMWPNNGPHIKIKTKKPASSAVTLMTEGEYGLVSLDIVLASEVKPQSWSQSTTNGLKIENWLGRKVRSAFRREPFLPGAETKATCECTRSPNRITERRSCLKLLKNLIEKLKEKHPHILAHVCSYHAKTTLLHACVKRPSDDMWRLEDLADCFLQLLDDFTEHLKSANLPHFFIPTCNLYGPQKFNSKSRIRPLEFIEKEQITFLSSG
ncbi:cyclic GMP-AMP synthase-like [Mobula birostris]|uniref:cyclic GMP-AMP synthase-like n=1 Tax=Mobula birostris TaxID=1983395 RepID=UPI003B27FEFE